MSTATDTVTATAPAHGRPGAPAYRLSTRGILRAEWTKLWSLRSTWYTLGGVVVLTLGLGLIIAGAYEPDDARDADFDPVALPLFGLNFAQLAVTVLGILAFTGEHSTGMIRSTLAAVPRRLPVLWAKAAVFGGVVLAISVPLAFLTFLLGQPFLSGTELDRSLTDPGVARGILGAAAFTAYGSVMGLAIGAILRRSPGAIAVYAGVAMILPELAMLLPWDWVNDAVRFLPFYSGDELGRAEPGPEALSTTAAYLVLAAWAAIGLATAALLIRRRDV
ncbi:ABC transporter permease [Streptomyces sp. 6N223]|uniref:ABC transporter permease n=1 Tax=Streptomyces sp. 6N223 TaxID=3457412 RepID=UPI003FD63326